MSIENIQEAYNTYFSSAFSVLEIFNNHFGEENVDTNIPKFEDLRNQGILTISSMLSRLSAFHSSVDIIVKFPEVTITNEKGNSVFVKNLFAKQTLLIRYDVNREDSTCVLSNAFTLSRSHFYKSHILADYMHSHCNGLPLLTTSSPWLSCCLGSGPIRQTISTLCTEYDLNVWQLYCFELESYVQTESLTGGPWRRMSNITSIPYSENPRINKYFTVFNWPTKITFKPLFRDFIEYFVRHTNIPFCYDNKSYMIAMPYLDFALTVSNKFIEWLNLGSNPYRYNEMLHELSTCGALSNYLIRDNKIEEPTSGRRSISDANSIIGRSLFTFKGSPVIVEVEEDLNNTCTTTTLLSNEILGYIATLLTKSINYYYGNKFYENSSSENSINRKYRFL